MTNSLPPQLSSSALEPLAEPTPAVAPAPPAPVSLRGRAAGLVRGTVEARGRARERARERTRLFGRRLVGLADEDPIPARIEQLQEEIDRLRRQLGADRTDAVLVSRETRSLIESGRVNQELLKGEYRTLLHQVEELGMAFAPATGLAGAGARFAELREAVNSLERRIRDIGLEAAPPPTDRPTDAPTSTPAEAKSSSLFNYVGFERRFRGDPDEILETLYRRYRDVLSDHQPVVDVGCGRGELLDRLAHDGIEVVGIEPDAGMAADARARGLHVEQTFAGDYLRGVADDSLGSIISTHVVEHLQLDHLIEFIELSVRKLVPGGVFVAETPNPSSLIVLGNSYIMDPTHVWPLHPSLLAFLAESAGFRDIRLNFYAPATGYHLAPVRTEGLDDPTRELAESVNAAFDRLNDVLFGPQDYAIVATKAPAEDA